MSERKKSPKSKSTKKDQKDKFFVLLVAQDRESLSRVVREEVLDVARMYPRTDAEEIEAHLFANQDQIARLKKKGWKLEVGRNLSQAGRERQKEVGKGDRFKGGKIPPRGLGKKSHRKGDE